MRKDKKGRNTAYKLGYYSGFCYYKDKGYLNCNIHEKIAIRTSYCGNVHPSVMVMNDVRDKNL